MRPRHVAPVPTAIAACVLVLAVAGCGGGGDKEGKTVTVTGGKVEVGAYDTYFDITTIETAPGDLEITLTEHGGLAHTLVIDGIDGFKLAVTSAGKTSTGTVALEAGTYKYLCDIPGHEGQGMKGELVVE